MDEVPKPTELLAVRHATERLFTLLRRWFGVDDFVTLDLRHIDSAVTELGDVQLVMAMAMRKLQALHLLTTPGVRTTTDVVLTVIQDLERALLQAPNVYLRQEAAEMDWDAALVAMERGDDQVDEGGIAQTDEIDEFRRHHASLHEAARAVLHVSEGRICILI